jgi:hypothetical protein
MKLPPPSPHVTSGAMLVCGAAAAATVAVRRRRKTLAASAKTLAPSPHVVPAAEKSRSSVRCSYSCELRGAAASPATPRALPGRCCVTRGAWSLHVDAVAHACGAVCRAAHYAAAARRAGAGACCAGVGSSALTPDVTDSHPHEAVPVPRVRAPLCRACQVRPAHAAVFGLLALTATRAAWTRPQLRRVLSCRSGCAARTTK